MTNFLLTLLSIYILPYSSFFYFYNSNIFDIIDINNNYNNKTTENQLVMLCRFYFCNDTVPSSDLTNQKKRDLFLNLLISHKKKKEKYFNIQVLSNSFYCLLIQ